MDFSKFRIDTTLNIEGIIAALAILGATIGFLINLVKKWRLDFKEKRYRGTNFVILDLLESNFQNGLSEDNLWNYYCSIETQKKRKSFSAYNPKKLKRIGFEEQLKHLQSRFLIRLTGPAHYHIEFSEPREWKRFYRQNCYLKILDKIKSTLGEEELKKILNETINSPDANFYRLKDTHRLLLEIGDDNAIEKIILDMRSGDMAIKKNAVELYVELNNETL